MSTSVHFADNTCILIYLNRALNAGLVLVSEYFQCGITLLVLALLFVTCHAVFRLRCQRPAYKNIWLNPSMQGKHIFPQPP